ncbi:hypothetical protein M422DRAFT_265421 [Sphaerobolus stellatus SS14]|uniref:Uncharacterized protein n=1 Tax=Sphaerobolus stellatus (strain SS14) TaxID=990650 RepID=A0A0C9UDK2_SPHS4|nr:hypothetical protein M422DRAFT_265421 [Sphaerobolus stellatus SS14]
MSLLEILKEFLTSPVKNLSKSSANLPKVSAEVMLIESGTNSLVQVHSKSSNKSSAHSTLYFNFFTSVDIAYCEDVM